MEELPNGFTGFSKRDPNFESASDAIRKAAIEQQGARPDAASAARAARNGWQAAQDALEGLPRLDQMGSLWGGSRKANGSGFEQFVNRIEFNGVADNRFDLEAISNIPESDRRWAWVQVDRSAIRHNVMALRNHVGPGVKIMAVVKADGYGHGAVECAKTAFNSGADYLGVATLDEAIELREALINAPVLILSEPPVEAIPLLLAYKVMPSVYTAEFAIRYAEAADMMGQRAPFHLALNTGMNRIGVRYDEAVAFMQHIGFHRALDIKGTFTHFATADAADTLDFEMQLRRFTEAIANLKAAGIDPGIVHAANSAATIRYPETHFGMVRVGIAMYGYHPCPLTRGLIDLKPAMTVRARVTNVNAVPMSEGVSYGLHYRSPGSVKICTVPLGYADGLWRGLSGRIDFIVGGVPFRQVGSICMDQCMFEVNMRTAASRKFLTPQIGDEVIIVGEQDGIAITMDELAELMGTISYEVTVRFGERLPKVYV